jgi:ABC-type transporter Mla subunit MlaD
VTTEQPQHARRWSWLGPRAFGIYLVIIAAVFSFSAIVGQSRTSDAINQAKAAAFGASTAAETANQSARDLRDALVCVQTWIKASNDRSSALSAASKQLNRAAANVNLGFNQLTIHNTARNVRKVIAALHRYVRVYRHYTKVQNAHPVPPLKQFDCAKAAKKHAKSHPAAKPKTKTVTATRTAPGPTVTVVQPGPTSTRTVTRTTTAPPGKGHG